MAVVNEEFDRIVKLLQSIESLDKLLMDQIEIISLKPVFSCIFKADKKVFTNIYNSIHGTVYAGLVDLLGGIVISLDHIEEQAAYFEKHGTPIRQVSSDINISYLSHASLGDNLYCEGKLLKKGKNLAFSQIDIYKDSSKKFMLATGRHTKFLSKSKL